jgi:hypothetical protein
MKLTSQQEERLRHLERTDPALAKEYRVDLAALGNGETSAIARGAARARVRNVEAGR